MRVIFLVSFLIPFISFGQVYQIMPQYGYEVKRMNFDSTLQIPTVCGVPTIKSVQFLKKAAIAFDSCNNRFYQYNPSNATWSYLGSGGGSQSLQQVTDVGNTTSNYIDLTDGISVANRLDLDNITITQNDVYIVQMGTNGGEPRFFLYDENIGSSSFELRQFKQDNEIYHYPINNGTNDTLATLADVRSVSGGSSAQNGRFGNDTATVVMAKIHNNSGTTLTNGKVVFLATSGTNSDAPSVRLANNKNDSTSANTFGFVSGTIANNDTGYVVLSGKIEQLNTSAFSNGDIIYLDSISGQWTKTKPVAPYHMVYLGVVVKANAGNGSIFVKCQNGYELDEIHDVLITSKTNNDVLTYESSSKLWKNKQISTVLGYTPIAPSDTATMLSKYLRKSDTSTLSNRINLKVNISDTSSMLTNYAKTSAVNLKVNISDTSAMLTNYVKKDTSCLYLISDVSTSNTTATNTNLTITLGANETYRIMVAGTASKATTTTGMKIAIGGPTGATLKGVFQGGGAATSTALVNQIISAPNTLIANAFATGTGVEVPFRFEGVITTSSTSGAVTLQFATVTGNAATIYAGTVMQLIKAKGL